MFESIKFINFQVHGNRTVDLDPHITMFVGPTDSGKSTIVRGLRFACLNQTPRGRYIRFGKDTCKVIVKVDGKVIKRKRSESLNTYTLDGKIFRAVGKGGVPEEISRLLNLSDDNFRAQLDLHFWLHDTGGQVSKNLNEIVNLGSIDKTLANVFSMLRTVRSSVQFSQQRLDRAKERRTELRWAKEFHRGVLELEGLESTREKTHRETLNLNELLVRGKTTRDNLERLAKAALAGRNAVACGQAALKARRRREDLEFILRRAKILRKGMEKTVPDIGPLVKIRTAADRVAEDRRDLEGVVDRIKSLGEDLCRYEKQLRETREELSKKTGGLCPVCGAPADPSQFCSPTSTSATSLPQQERRSRTGMKLKPEC